MPVCDRWSLTPSGNCIQIRILRRLAIAGLPRTDQLAHETPCPFRDPGLAIDIGLGIDIGAEQLVPDRNVFA